MSFRNQGARPNYISSIDPISLNARQTDLDTTHGHFIGNAVTFLSGIRPEDFNAPRALWQKVWDEPARERFINNVSGKMEMCKEQEILKRQIAIFREVDNDIAVRLEKATGIKGYDGIKDMKFNGTYNFMKGDVGSNPSGIPMTAGRTVADANAPALKGSHAGLAY